MTRSPMRSAFSPTSRHASGALLAFLGCVLAPTPTLMLGCGGATEGAALPGSDASAGEDASAPTKPSFDSLTSCSKPGACELNGKGCCGLSCLDNSEVVAIRRGERTRLRQATCEAPEPVVCPDCPRPLNPNIQAFCEVGRCSVVDLRTHAISTCEKNDDCSLRYGSCCQPCRSSEVGLLVAVAKNDLPSLERQICSGEETCEKCLPTIPEGAFAVCNPATKHCEVEAK